MAEERLKLLTEYVNASDLSYLVEDKNDGTKDKSYRIKGPFIMCEQRNQNGRIYRKRIVSPEVERYTNTHIKMRKSLGNISHPESCVLKYEDSAILTESLIEDGNNYIGTAMVLDTPYGKILKALMNDNILISCSTRGLGSLLPNGEVNDNFKLIATDCCVDPSASIAVTESLIEQFDWVVDGDSFRQVAVETFQKDLSKNGTRNLENDLRKFITALKNKI
jgi:hypothetical protein